MTMPPSGDPEIDRALAELAARMEGLEEVNRLIEASKGRGESAGGHVTVEVSATGGLASLRIDPRAMRLGSERLTEAITEAFRKAEEDAAGRSFEAAKTLFDR
ncbi:YbaB/EbfC family nucleoid-associated protein [Nonomuraea sp. NPDC046802]|uniref:YbaB/EbfC family nucleoid-associated protein n=1 Tax=Nonomuraea sp. NPDC046802 TaxID=3154919 RepID=UPI003402F28F